MLYRSTRGNGKVVGASAAIIRGIAEDGGLYVPEEFPKITKSFQELGDMNYRELAFYIIKKYFDDFSDDELRECIDRAYDEKFENSYIAPLNYKAEAYFLELYHGKTLAFKDMALSILPYLLKTAVKKIGITKEIVILTATSGDTGKAALEGFDSVDKTKIVVFYPKDGVSEIQKRQMTTQEGKNTFVVGIEGNFDDAQNGVKEIFSDKAFNELLNKNNYMLSSANSINIGRLVPQVVYYVYSYAKLLKDKKIQEGESINVVVPTGNFGNILAAFYAKAMGVPLGRLICASNENKVLTDFINTGIYDRRREFSVTNSPSMDILISSNLERFLYEISDRDEQLINNLMKQLKEEGKYEINEDMKEKLKILYGDFADEKETLAAVKKVYETSEYVIDTHTAVAYEVYEKYKKNTYDDRAAVIASTASPFKFPRSINEVLNFANSSTSDFEMVQMLSEKMGVKIPRGIESLDKKEIRHKVTCKKDEMREVIKNFLGE
ncbi:threonine synthase [Clostridium sp. OS1-26]|uniref:threonine synthase n=1 Tax=Clostridium sp. OS1-26 TaxID=3070681 RepID=UPI0027E1A983|nr:threonine synthase [Clostridium sp. OS1-26]WML37633.1 threonine synthase [Clostridium sp. OS1-26]